MKKRNSTVCSGEIYFIDGPKMMKGPGVVINNDKRPLGARTIWANRPGVVITSDEYNKGSDDVFVVFLTKRTYNMEDWYKSFSPRQTDVQCSYETYTALCSFVVSVEKKYLGKWMGEVTQEELTSITTEVKKDETVDRRYFPLLYQAKNRDDSFQTEYSQESEVQRQ